MAFVWLLLTSPLREIIFQSRTVNCSGSGVSRCGHRLTSENIWEMCKLNSVWTFSPFFYPFFVILDIILRVIFIHGDVSPFTFWGLKKSDMFTFLFYFYKIFIQMSVSVLELTHALNKSGGTIKLFSPVNKKNVFFSSFF